MIQELLRRKAIRPIEISEGIVLPFAEKAPESRPIALQGRGVHRSFHEGRVLRAQQDRQAPLRQTRVDDRIEGAKRGRRGLPEVLIVGRDLESERGILKITILVPTQQTSDAPLKKSLLRREIPKGLEELGRPKQIAMGKRPLTQPRPRGLIGRLFPGGRRGRREKAARRGPRTFLELGGEHSNIQENNRAPRWVASQLPDDPLQIAQQQSVGSQADDAPAASFGRLAQKGGDRAPARVGHLTLEKSTRSQNAVAQKNCQLRLMRRPANPILELREARENTRKIEAVVPISRMNEKTAGDLRNEYQRDEGESGSGGQAIPIRARPLPRALVRVYTNRVWSNPEFHALNYHASLGRSNFRRVASGEQWRWRAGFSELKSLSNIISIDLGTLHASGISQARDASLFDAQSPGSLPSETRS